MEGVRTARLAHERHQLICERLNILHDVISAREDLQGRRTAKSDIQAGFSDLALAPQFQALAEAPSTTEITRADFEALQDTIPALAAEWFAERKAELLPKVEAVLKAPNGVDPLSLAIVTFHCASCEREDLRWPNILAHKCVRGSTYIGAPYKRALSTVCAKKGQRFPWRDRKNVFSISPKVAAARSVVAACGLDPDMATHEEMDECEARLVCTACSADPMVQCREALDWWRAVRSTPIAPSLCSHLFGHIRSRTSRPRSRWDQNLAVEANGRSWTPSSLRVFVSASKSSPRPWRASTCTSKLRPR